MRWICREPIYELMYEPMYEPMYELMYELMHELMQEPKETRRPVSSPDRREIARIHTGGVCRRQYSRT
jgi:hypothetical protein